MRNWKEIQEYYDLGHSRIECLKKFNCSNSTWTYGLKKGKLIQRIKKLPITGAWDIRDKRYGKLLVLDLENNEKGNVTWKCRCDCGNICIKSSHNIQFNSKSCGCIKYETGIKCSRWKGCEEISVSLFNRYRHGALRRNIEFSLNIEYLWNLFMQQNKKCALSGVELILIKTTKQKRTASLDRLDSQKGYIEGNVQWVHKTLNKLKSDIDNQKFIDFSKRIYYTMKNKGKYYE